MVCNCKGPWWIDGQVIEGWDMTVPFVPEPDVREEDERPRKGGEG